jgi:FixJ family two-component response regulator
MQLPESDTLIAIVDDDPSAREGLSSLIRSAGWRVETYASAQEFLARPPTEAPCCLILDLQLPGLSGDSPLRSPPLNHTVRRNVFGALRIE